MADLSYPARTVQEDSDESDERTKQGAHFNDETGPLSYTVFTIFHIIYSNYKTLQLFGAFAMKLDPSLMSGSSPRKTG